MTRKRITRQAIAEGSRLGQEKIETAIRNYTTAFALNGLQGMGVPPSLRAFTLGLVDCHGKINDVLSALAYSNLDRLITLAEMADEIESLHHELATVRIALGDANAQKQEMQNAVLSEVIAELKTKGWLDDFDGEGVDPRHVSFFSPTQHSH